MAGPIQLQWALEQSGTDAFAITKGLLKAATSDNVQIIALLACERFGNTLAMSPMTLRKVEKLMLPCESATMKYLKCTIGFFKDDCATALGQSAAGLRFLGLVAALVTTDDPFRVAESLDIILRESAKDLTMIPTVSQLHDLLLSLRPRAYRCGFADSVVGWETLVRREILPRLHNDNTPEYVELIEMRSFLELLPNSATIAELLQSFREIGRTGDDESFSLTIKTQRGLPWLLAFTEWCVGTPALYYENEAILQPANSCCRIVCLRHDESTTLTIHQRMRDVTRLFGNHHGYQYNRNGMLSLETYGIHLLRRLGLQARTIRPQVHGLLRRLIPIWSDALQNGTISGDKCFWASVMWEGGIGDCEPKFQHDWFNNNHGSPALSLPSGCHGGWQRTLPSVSKILEACDLLFGGDEYVETPDDDKPTIQWLEALAQITQGTDMRDPTRDLIGAKLLLGLPHSEHETMKAFEDKHLPDDLFMLFMEAACMAVVSSASWPSLRFSTDFHRRYSFRTQSCLKWESEKHTQNLYQLVLWWLSEMLGQDELSPSRHSKEQYHEDFRAYQDAMITAGSGQVVYHSVCQSTEVYCMATSIELCVQPGSLRFRDQHFDIATGLAIKRPRSNARCMTTGFPSLFEDLSANYRIPQLLHGSLPDLSFAELQMYTGQKGKKTLNISTKLRVHEQQDESEMIEDIVMMPEGDQKVFILSSCEHTRVEINQRDKQSLNDSLADDWLPCNTSSSIFASQNGKAWKVLIVHTKGNCDAQYYVMANANTPVMVRQRGACIPCCMNACKELRITILCT